MYVSRRKAEKIERVGKHMLVVVVLVVVVRQESQIPSCARQLCPFSRLTAAHIAYWQNKPSVKRLEQRLGFDIRYEMFQFFDQISKLGG